VEQAIEELVRFRGTQFDTRVVDAILQLFREGEFDDLRVQRAQPTPPLQRQPV